MFIVYFKITYFIRSISMAQIIFHRETSNAISLPRGIKQLYKYRQQLLLTIERNFAKTGSSLLRKNAVCMLEFLAHVDCVNLGEMLTSSRVRELCLDPSTLVRRQLITSTEVMLAALPNSTVVMETFARVTLSLALDNDAKVVEMVADSFRRHLFERIVPAERTRTDETEQPWRLLRALLAVSEVPSVRSCIGGWVNRRLLTPAVLAHIESHVHTDRSEEAWELLSMVSSLIPSRNPALAVSVVVTNLRSQVSEQLLCNRSVFTGKFAI